MKGMPSAITRYLVVAILAIGIGYLAGQAAPSGMTAGLKAAAPEATARAFFEAMAAGDYEAAAQFALGHLSTSLSLEESAAIDRSRIGALQVAIEASSDAWAAGTVRVENQLTNGHWDVLWYQIQLAKTGDGWRVVRVSPAGPTYAGKGGDLPADFSGQAFTDYLALMADGRWSEAADRLVGIARITHETSQTTLGAAGQPLFESYTQPTLSLLWAQPDTVVMHAAYTVDNRPVVAQVTFVRTQGGWYVADVAAQ